MEETPEYLPPRRTDNLSDRDIERLRMLLADHPCKFAVTHDQMDKIVRMSNFFEQVEQKIVGGITWAFIAIIGGILWMFYNHGYFIKKG